MQAKLVMPFLQVQRMLTTISQFQLFHFRFQFQFSVSFFRFLRFHLPKELLHSRRSSSSSSSVKFSWAELVTELKIVKLAGRGVAIGLVSVRGFRVSSGGFGIGRQKLKDGVRYKAAKGLDIYVDFAFHFHSLLLSKMFTEVIC